MKYLIVVDMQKDFITGSLGTGEACAILPDVIEKIKGFDGKVIFTKDTHTEDYLDTQEGKNLPVKHCIEGEDGWMLADELEKMAEELGSKIYNKPTFGCVELAKNLSRRMIRLRLMKSSFAVCAPIYALFQMQCYVRLLCPRLKSQ